MLFATTTAITPILPTEPNHSIIAIYVIVRPLFVDSAHSPKLTESEL
jgi:hypothetical protein